MNKIVLSKLLSKTMAVGIIKGEFGYPETLKEAFEFAGKYGMKVADVPMAIEAMSGQPRMLLPENSIDTLTAEYQGLRNGERSYEVWQSIGSLATLEGAGETFNNCRSLSYGFSPVDNAEWDDAGKGKYLGKDVIRVHLEDVRKGNVPLPGIPYTAFFRPDSDRHYVSVDEWLDYDEFMKDDRVLTLAGNPDSRESFAKLLFFSRGEDDEYNDFIESNHLIRPKGADVSDYEIMIPIFGKAMMDNAGKRFESPAKGRLIRYGLGGIKGGFRILNPDETCFLAVKDGIDLIDDPDSAFEPLLRPSIEQTLEVVNDTTLNREEVAYRIRDLYTK